MRSRIAESAEWIKLPFASILSLGPSMEIEIAPFQNAQEFQKK